MSARHASARAGRISDPLGVFMGWLWALGTAAGFLCLGVLVGDDLDGQAAIGPALASPDYAPAAA
ncbi:hypothetical protein ACX6XY_15550 [Streptomyces sp. O3]